MNFFDLVKSRRSIRKFKSKSVNKDDILKILDAANWAPSALNKQDWEFIVISGEWIKRLGNSFSGVVKELTNKIDKTDDSNAIIFNNEFMKFASIYGGAPVIIVVLTKVSEDLKARKAYLESASAAMENLILAATDLGLGTCWMTGPLRDEKNLRLILNVADDLEIVALTPLGYPHAIPNPLPRKDPDLNQKVTWLE